MTSRRYKRPALPPDSREDSHGRAFPGVRAGPRPEDAAREEPAAVLEGRGAADTPEPLDDPVIALIKRGQAEGPFDPDVTPAWIQRVLWSLVYTGYQDAEACGLPRHGIVSAVIRTLENGIRTPNPEHRQV
ncbi:hypothetical protein ACWC9F_32470 [Streptomyces sp. NPDC001110]|uniref:hypothetical protein n=1 Tax=Streptomyces TaxID=1883 RepID=UPI001ADEE552|nr:hypothetical protein [[Kitasatospora] papulosa]